MKRHTTAIIGIIAWYLLLLPPAFGVNAQSLISSRQPASAVSPYFWPVVFVLLVILACVAMARSKKQ